MTQFTVTVAFPCPFCGLDAKCVEPAGVMHLQPACRTFLDLDVVTYIRAVNEMELRRN